MRVDDAKEWRCPWCGCWMTEAHPECKEAATDQYNQVRALTAAIALLLNEPVRYVDNEIHIETDSSQHARELVQNAREVAGLRDAG